MAIAGKTVVIVGGTSGIGLATARILATRGADVVIAGRNEERMGDAVSVLAPLQVRGHSVDACDRSLLDTFFSEIGSLDHLVLCVSGHRGGGPFAHIELDDVRHAFAEKALAQVECLQAALSHMRSGGSATFVSAAIARQAVPGTAGLAMVSGALEAAVRPLAAELAPTRVNAVAPGVIDTPWWPTDARATFFPVTANAAAVGRVGTPDDVGEAIASLVENDFITGTVMVCDGGMRLRGSP